MPPFLRRKQNKPSGDEMNEKVELFKTRCQAFNDAWDYRVRQGTNDGSPAMHYLKELLYAIINGELDGTNKA